MSTFRSRGPLALTDAEVSRFWAKVERTDGCWLWTASTGNHGYGQMGVAGTVMLAHRISYLLHHGDLTPGLTIDHLCGVLRCVNPEHLEQVTVNVNAARLAVRQKRRIGIGADYLGQPEVVEMLRIGRPKLMALTAAGVIPAELVEGRWRYRRSDIDAFLADTA